ncbi:MAG: hypothetical protein J6125_01715 [Clostridia bacterium]|nr:hypothetical protein [Clostridia bacterium]
MRAFFRPSAFALILCLLFCPALPSCAKTPVAIDLFSDFSARYGLPEGVVYDSTAAPGTGAYLDRETFGLLYARADGTDDWEDFESCAIWLGASSARVTEAAVFVCRDRERADRLLDLCRRRLALLRSLSDAADVSAADDAVILVRGETVAYFVLPDNARAERVFRRLT